MHLEKSIFIIIVYGLITQSIGFSVNRCGQSHHTTISNCAIPEGKYFIREAWKSISATRMVDCGSGAIVPGFFPTTCTSEKFRTNNITKGARNITTNVEASWTTPAAKNCSISHEKSKFIIILEWIWKFLPTHLVDDLYDVLYRNGSHTCISPEPTEREKVKQNLRIILADVENSNAPLHSTLRYVTYFVLLIWGISSVVIISSAVTRLLSLRKLTAKTLTSSNC